MISGIQIVLGNLKASQANVAAGVQKGLLLAGLRLQRESQRKVPVDFGPLKASAYTRQKGTGVNTEVFVGYTASYALHVHEQVAMKLKGLPRKAPSKGRYWDPQGRAQAKFLEEPARTLLPVLTDIVKKSIKITP